MPDLNLNFASDNTGPVAPEIWAAMTEANAGGVMPYGADPWSEVVRDRLRALLGWPEAEVLLVTTGTAANALALSALVRPWETVLCHARAHIHEDECAAPEFYTGGAKLTLVSGDHGRMTPDALRAALAPLSSGAVHSVVPGALSLTNVTEMGTVYSSADLDALCEVARGAGMRTHLDGARLANACAAASCTPAEMARGFDVVGFGGTKNGCMGVEAVMVRDPGRKRELEYRRKRAGHLWSKHRFLSAQMAAYLDGDLWLDLARRANAAAARLAAGLTARGVEMVYPPEANVIFCRLPRAVHERAAGRAQFYLMDAHPERPLARLVCDPTKTEAEVDRLLELLFP